MDNFCIKKLNVDVQARITSGMITKYEKCNILLLGFDDQIPLIISYRLDKWTSLASSRIHTQKITKLAVYNDNYLLSGSSSGLIGLHDLGTLKTLISCSHTSGT